MCEKPLAGREPVDAIPTSDDLVIAISLVLLMEPVAIDLRAIDSNAPPESLFARPVQPTNRRLATFCIWLN
ncbi:MAG TPA: hypothetical protein PK400_00090 [Phycisphaerales bacterium]|nr:hypothetical protein [Phycisphaerales bacterium]HRQ75184.1 hypothetical protein [Phycisphaerales bacterium]